MKMFTGGDRSLNNLLLGLQLRLKKNEESCSLAKHLKLKGKKGYGHNVLLEKNYNSIYQQNIAKSFNVYTC